MITSHVILPPHPLIFPTNRELISAGYKIQYKDNTGTGVSEAREGFRVLEEMVVLGVVDHTRILPNVSFWA